MAKILLVDDDGGIRELLKEFLTNAGNIVVTAIDGEDALSKWNKDIFDLAVVDVDMPNKNGIELTKEIRIINTKFPIILITAYSHLYNAAEILMLGVEAFLKKPLDLENFLDAVTRIKNKLNVQ